MRVRGCRRSPLLVLPFLLGAVPAAAAGERYSVRYDAQAKTATITVRAHDGRVAWRDCLRGLTCAKGFDASALDGALPGGSIDITSFFPILAIVGLDLALAPSVRLAIVPPDLVEREPALRITLDRQALLATSSRLKKRLREAVRHVQPRGGRRFGLTLDPHWQRAPPAKKLVVFIPGLNSAPGKFASFLDELRRLDLPCGALDYPNDQPIEESARLLSTELRKIAAEQPTRQVALVTSSMGGLIARAAVEDPWLNPGNVRQLVMVAPPSQGSRLAEFAFALELWEHGVEKRRRGDVARFYAAIEDGLGEAYDELMPGSDFLTRLNARPRHPKIQYSLLLGSGGLLDDAAVEAMRRALKRAGESNRFVKFLGPRLDAALADLDEVKRGRGDGAVSIARGRLAGVEDVVVLPFNHLTMFLSGATAAEKRLRR